MLATLAFALIAQLAPTPSTPSSSSSSGKPLVVHQMDEDVIVGSLQRSRNPSEHLRVARVKQKFDSLIRIREDFKRELLATAP